MHCPLPSGTVEVLSYILVPENVSGKYTATTLPTKMWERLVLPPSGSFGSWCVCSAANISTIVFGGMSNDFSLGKAFDVFK
jgi:hypothetical protein